MPLRAFINDKEILSFEQTDNEWIALNKEIKSKEGKLLLSCCKQEGFLRTSSKGLKHFVHVRSENTCDWKPESPEHLKAKMEIVSACKENGWHAIPEFSENNWRADVLAVHGKKRIAFEVQWSKQTFAETKFRQDRYKESNVRGCWFFREVPKEMKDNNDYPESAVPQKEIPAFLIFKDEYENIVAKVNYRKIHLKRLVGILLKGKFRPCKYMLLRPKQPIVLTFFKFQCWQCKKEQHCWTVSDTLLTMCRQHWNLSVIEETVRSFSKHPEVYKAVQSFLLTEKGNHLRVGLLKTRNEYSGYEGTLLHGCYYCAAPFYDQFLNNIRIRLQEDSTVLEYKTEIDIGEMREEMPHWCYSENGHFCE